MNKHAKTTAKIVDNAYVVNRITGLHAIFKPVIVLLLWFWLVIFPIYMKGIYFNDAHSMKAWNSFVYALDTFAFILILQIYCLIIKHLFWERGLIDKYSNNIEQLKIIALNINKPLLDFNKRTFWQWSKISSIKLRYYIPFVGIIWFLTWELVLLIFPPIPKLESSIINYWKANKRIVSDMKDLQKAEPR